MSYQDKHVHEIIKKKKKHLFNFFEIEMNQMKIIEWRNIPSTRFPISYKYFFDGSKRRSSHIFYQICKLMMSNVLFF